MSLMAQAVPAPAVQPIARRGLIQRCGGISCPPGTCNHTDDPADARVQRSANGTAAVGGSGVPASVLRVLDTVGTPLDVSTRTSMEARLGHDFGHVRVHTDAEAARSAKSIQAQAYTFGSHVVMGEGRFQPHTPAGIRLLAHELTHVVQQVGASAPARSVSGSDDPSEREAERAADFMRVPRAAPAPTDRVHRATDEQKQLGLDQSTDGLLDGSGPDGSGPDGSGSDGGLAPGGVGGDFGGQSIGDGGQSGGGGSSGGFDEAPPGAASALRPTPIICSRPIAVRGLGAFRHAFVNDPPANYAIREPLYSGNGISGCANSTDASGPPDDPATSTCKACLPPPGQTLDDLSSCLRNVHLGYASPGIYRNLPDPGDGWSWGPNSNSYAAAMARCCDNFDPSGLGRLPGWNHSPAKPCPSTVPSVSPGGGGAPAAPGGGSAPAGVPGVLRQVAVQPVTFKDADDDPNPTGGSWPTRYGWTGNIWGKLGVQFTAASPVEIVSADLKTAGGDRASRDKVRASWNGPAVGVFLVDNDVADAGGGGTVGGGAAGAKIALSDRGGSVTLLAHEMGHVLGLGHPPGDADSDTVMEPSGSNDDDNPTRNTLDNYNRILWPAPSGSVIINPDP